MHHPLWFETEACFPMDRARTARFRGLCAGNRAFAPRCDAHSESGVGQTRLFDDVDAMSGAPSIATECCIAVSGASGQ
jgi:hypothetical protein